MNDKYEYLIELLTALMAGEQIQRHVDEHTWSEVECTTVAAIKDIVNHPKYYRIKPKIGVVYVNINRFKGNYSPTSTVYISEENAISAAKAYLTKTPESEYLVIAHPIEYEEPE